MTDQNEIKESIEYWKQAVHQYARCVKEKQK